MLLHRIATITAFAFTLCIPPALAMPQTGNYYAAEVHKIIYPSPAVARPELQHAIATATRQNKNILLDFGGNWCGDCRVLDFYFHQPPNSGLLARNFILVDINVGQFHHNLGLAKKFNIPIHKGVPALAVLNSNGSLLYSQTGGQFENMSRVSPTSVTAFLELWKPSR